MFATCVVYAQTCEKVDKKLFHLLPKDMSDTINCKDASGKKQGWWIYYKVLYNPDKFITEGEAPPGNYVQEYYYGKYKDGRRIGKWVNMNNVHIISPTCTNYYEYKGDTMYVKSDVIIDTFTNVYIGDSVIKDYFKKYYSN